MTAEPAASVASVPPAAEFVRAGHRARWLDSGTAAYREIERMIEAAQSSVRLESYLVRPQGPALRLRDALVRAARRGVQVSVLTDAYGSSELPADYFAELRALGGTVSTFNPVRLLRLSFRNHRKLLVCDRSSAVVGGFNIGAEYEGDGISRGWRDIGLAVSGPVAAGLADSFDDMLKLAPFTASALRRFRARAREHARAVDAVQLLTSGPGCRHAALRRSLNRDLATARYVSIMAAYFLPSSRIRRGLRRCVQRGGRVQLLLAGRTDAALAKLAGEHRYAQMLGAGIDVYEYQPQVLHAKLLIIDEVVYVGSCNLDKRSLEINYELLLRLDWPELAAAGRRLFLDDLDRSTRVVPARWLAGRSPWRRLRRRIAHFLLARVDPLVANRKLRALT